MKRRSKMKFLVGIQMYSLRDDAKKNLYGTLKKVKEMGYDGVEFAGLYGHTPEEVREMCEDLELIPISAHVSYKAMMANENIFAEYAAIGCKYVVFPHMAEADRPDGANFAEALANMKKFCERAKEHGLQMLYHNHDFEFCKIGEKYGLDVIYEEIDADLLKTEIDTCWVKVAGEDPAAYVRKYTGRAPVVHLKDYVGERSLSMYELIGEAKLAAEKASGFEFRPIGYGKQNFEEILSAASDAGANWVIVEQDRPSMDLTPAQSARLSREYLYSIGC